MLGKDPT